MADKKADGKAKSTPKLRQQRVTLKHAYRLKPSSQQWLARQLNDPYVTAAKQEGYRSRAAWKILQLDEQFKIFRPGMSVLDLGAAPGGWSQIACQKVGIHGTVVALDYLAMEPLEGVEFLQADFMDAAVPDKLLALLKKQRTKNNRGLVDAVLSDMAAPTTGHSNTDHIRIMALAGAAYDFARSVLNPDGIFVCKLFQGGAERQLQTKLVKDFRVVKYAKPDASRKESSETYLVAKGFRG